MRRMPGAYASPLHNPRGLLNVILRGVKPAGRGERDDESILRDLDFFCQRYRLAQGPYFAKRGEWSNAALFESMRLRHDPALPTYLFPWHSPILKFLDGCSREVKILDICCGLAPLFVKLTEMGFTKLRGIDDSHFQPGVVAASAAFLDWVGLEGVVVDDFYPAYAPNYSHLERNWDVVLLLGVSTLNLHEIA